VVWGRKKREKQKKRDRGDETNKCKKYTVNQGYSPGRTWGEKPKKRQKERGKGCVKRGVGKKVWLSDSRGGGGGVFQLKLPPKLKEAHRPQHHTKKNHQTPNTHKPSNRRGRPNQRKPPPKQTPVNP